MVKKVFIMTKSVKDRGYCVAGIDVENGEWIRFVSSKSGNAIEKEVMDDEKDPIEVLDVIAVNLEKHVPHKCQTENWLLDIDTPIIKQGIFSLNSLLRIKPLDRPDYIFVNDKSELEISEIRGLKNSLSMIEADCIVFDTSMKGDGRHHQKIKFKYNGSDYAICLTDPQFRKEEMDEFPLKKAIVVISISSEPYGENDLYYKFAARIFPIKIGR
jgi:hypothetical protein